MSFARRPLAISHRGDNREFPENSIPAFLRAIELGADGIELDVHATNDGHVVVHHDPVVHAEGMPESKRAIADLSAAELKNVSLQDDIPVPTLREVLEAVSSSVVVFVEIKALNIEELVVREIRESGADCVVHSFDHRIVANVRRIFPAIRTGILQVARLVDPIAALRAAGASDLWQDVNFIDEELVVAAHSADSRVIAWTSNEQSQWESLSRIGVDGICTDRIGDLAARPR